MLVACFAFLGAASSRTLSLSGLIFIVSFLAVAVVAEGAMNNRGLSTVILDAVLMLVVVEGAYVGAALLETLQWRPLAFWKPDDTKVP